MADDGQRRRRQRVTQRGYATPAPAREEEAARGSRPQPPSLHEVDEETTDVDELPEHSGSGPPSAARQETDGGEPEVEIEHVKERGSPALLQGPWRAVEVWTHNRIYVLDGTLVCIDVIDRNTGRSDGKHSLIGARLFGGQRRRKNGAIGEVSHPMPRRGAAAVFGERVGNRFSMSETSPVTRVVLRTRVVTVGSEDEPPSWEEITGDHGKP